MTSSSLSQRFSFISNFDHLTVIPIPHLNVMNCIGMGSKTDYLIWREKNGFFTALDKNSNLFTWSITSGQLLYNEIQKKDGCKSQMEPYAIYQANKNTSAGHKEDCTYTRDYYNLSTMSLTLLKSKRFITTADDPRMKEAE